MIMIYDIEPNKHIKSRKMFTFRAVLKMRQIRNSKIWPIKQLPNLDEKLSFKFQEKILKNVAILVTEIKQTAQTELQLILRNF